MNILIKDEIKLFIDKNGFVSPQVPDPQYGSDNGTLFTSEYYILLQKLGLLEFSDVLQWNDLIRSVYLKIGLTSREPNRLEVDAPDNFYGIIAATKKLRVPSIAKEILSYGLNHYGFYNDTNPGNIKNKDGSWNWLSFQFRQPQIIFALLCASGLYRWYKPHHCLLMLYTGIVIATSCIGVNTGDSDSRRLAWLLIQAVNEDSLLCRLASKLFEKRLLNDYNEGMLGVYKIYYKPLGIHPFTKYMVKF